MDPSERTAEAADVQRHAHQSPPSPGSPALAPGGPTTRSAPRLSGDRVVLVPATDADVPTILWVLTSPTVARVWAPVDAAQVRADLADPDLEAWLVTVDDQPVGYIQCATETDPMYRHASLDLALHDDHQGHGYGSDAVRTLARHLFHERGHHRLTIDPAADNEPAVRCYRSVGFRAVGVMRQYERGTDGTWHDGLLMDLLAGELR